MECFRLLFDHVAWIEHQFLSGIRRKRPALLKSGQWHFHQDNTQVHNSILVTDYLTKMGVKTIPQPSHSPDLAPCDFWLFPELIGCCYETSEEMKEAVTKVTDTLTQNDFYGTFQKLLEQYNKCIAAGGDYFEAEYSFMCVLSIKVPIRKRSGNLLKAPRMSKSYRIAYIVYKLFFYIFCVVFFGYGDMISIILIWYK